MKKVLATVMASLMVLSMASCSSGGSGSSAAPGSAAKGNTAASTVNCWYLWTGDEGKYLEKIISDYNKSQSKYKVVGLSSPDQQKIITSISGGKGPDISDCFGSSMAKYANDGIAMALDDLMSKNSVTSDQFVTSAIKQQEYQGKIYALPVSLNIDALYYNKKLLKDAGVTEVPKTAEDLLTLADKLTKTSGGKVTQLGSPLVPSTGAWYQCLTFAFGTDFGKSDGSTITPENDGFKKMLAFEESQVKKFGTALNNFVTSGDAKQYTAQDPFLNGTQALRIDGPWLFKMAKDAKIDFDLTGVPGSSSTGGYGYTVLDTSNFFIPSNAKNVDGAFDFLKYVTTGDGARTFITLKGDLPAVKSLTTDQKIIGISESYKVFLDIVAQNHMVLMPDSVKVEKYGDDLSATITSVLTGTSAADALSKLATKVKAYA